METIVCDLDGVVWRGRRPIPGAADAVAALRDAGRRVAFLTNNSSRPVADVCDQLEAMGIPATADDVVSSAHAAAALLAGDVPSGSEVLVCGGPGIHEALAGVGLAGVDPVAGAPGAPAAVVCGMDRAFDYDRLDRVAAAVRGGARFVATNDDPTYPGEDHVRPGAGAIVAAVAVASGRSPEVAGKPHEPAASLVRARFGTRGIMVGDRPSTDGAFARRLGWPFAMVLTGIGGHDPDEPVGSPDHLADDIAGLVPMLLA